MGLLTTIVLGIAGSFVGGYLSHLMTHGIGAEIQSSSLIWSVVGAVVLLLGYSWVSKP
jgi:uncharacterized membrane protein YeaQ/YmgE (transglycosylase-associated protein family)